MSNWISGILSVVCFIAIQAAVEANDKAAEAERQLDICLNGGLIGKSEETKTALVCRGAEEIKQISLVCPVRNAC